MTTKKTLMKPKSVLYLFFILMLIALFCSCAPKVYVSSYSNPSSNVQDIRKVAIVLENHKVRDNDLFGEIFLQTVIEKNKLPLVEDQYFFKNMISISPKSDADAFIAICLTHCYPGSLTRTSPTSIGARVHLLDAKTSKLIWNMNYGYRSYETGPDAPMVEEVLKLVSEKLVESIPIRAKAPVKISARTNEKIVKTTESEKPKEIVIKKEDNPPTIVEDKTPPPVITQKTEIVYKALPDDDYFSVQTGAFLMKENAVNRLNYLETKGYFPYLVKEYDPEKRLWHTIHIGKYPTKTQAQIAATKVNKKTDLETAVRLFDGQ